jgi:hypothetical protein
MAETSDKLHETICKTPRSRYFFSVAAAFSKSSIECRSL